MTYEQSKDIAQKFAQVAPQGYTYVVRRSESSWGLEFTRPTDRAKTAIRVYADGSVENPT